MTADVPANAIIWFEIPVTDLASAMRFYSAVLDTELSHSDDGPNPIAVFPGGKGNPAGHLYPGKPAAAGTGNTVHLAVSGDLQEAMTRVTDNGGQVVSPVVTIPAGSFFYATDPDGNSFGLFKV